MHVRFFFFFFQNYSTSSMKAQCPDSQCLFAFYGGETIYHKYLIGLQFYNVFLLFWCANFVIGLGQMTLAGAFASYYWAFVKPNDIPKCPIFSSMGRALRCVQFFADYCRFFIWLFILVRLTCTLFKVSHRKSGIWLFNPCYRSDYQGTSGVFGPQTERSCAFCSNGVL